MTAERPSEIIIRYPRFLFAYVTGVCAALVAAALYLSVTALEDFAENFWLVVAVAIALFAAYFSVPSMFTHHTATEQGLRIRMGLLINAFIPYDSIASAAPIKVERGLLKNRIGIGVMHKQNTDTIYVLSSFQDTVIVNLRDELRAGVFGTRASHVVFNVDAMSQVLDLVDRMTAGEEA